MDPGGSTPLALAYSLDLRGPVAGRDGATGERCLPRLRPTAGIRAYRVTPACPKGRPAGPAARRARPARRSPLGRLCPLGRLGRLGRASVGRADARRAPTGAESLSESILLRVAQSDPAAVKECLDRYGGLVWSLARRFHRDPADAEDAVQEIFISLWQSAGRYDPRKASEATFIATIARRRLIDRLRSRGRRPDLEGTDDGRVEMQADPGASPETFLDVARVAEALEKLRPEQRRMVELSVARGLTHQQISAQTGVALGTVKSHVRRGLIRVREMLHAENEGGGSPS